MNVVDQIPMPRPRQQQVTMADFLALVERVKELEAKLEEPKRGRQPKQVE